MHSSEGGGRASSLSKRRSSLIRKANEICFFGDADVAFVAFSPCGRLTKFSSKNRIEDILQKYVDLPAGQRYKHLKDVDQGKVVKLRELKHIEGEDNKLHYLSNQIHHLELQIKKAQVDIEILDANLRDYELHPEQQSHSLPQLLWCEKNLNRELQRVLHRKNHLTGSNCSSPYNGRPFMTRRDVLERGNLGSVSSQFSSCGGEELTRPNQNLSYSQLIMKLDPWISPYSSKVRDTIIRDIINGPGPDHNGTTSGNFGESSSRPVTDQTCPLDVLYNTSPPLDKTIPDCHLSDRPFVPTPMNVTSGDNSNTNVDDGNYGDGNYGDGPNTKYSATAPTNPTPEDPPRLHGISSEDEVGNGGFGSRTNQEFGSPDWDGFVLADNLNFDDLDIVF